MKSLYNKHCTLLIMAMGLCYGLGAQNGPIGWGSFGAGTTGGAGGDTVVVTTRAELAAQVNGADPRVILVQDTIVMNEYERMSVGSNKTLLGLGQNAMIQKGGFEIKGDNVIVQNLTIGDFYDGDWSGETHSADALTLYGVNIWIDHCDLFAASDGLLDIRAENGEAANFITVSNVRFSNHNKVMLIGSSNTEIVDRGKLKTTIVNCWFDGTIERGLHQRMPRTRFGDLHIFNNYFEDIASYCSAARFESDLVVEANYYRTSNDPHFREDIGMGIEDPELRAFDNYYELTSGRKESEGDAFDPSLFYDYTPLPAEEVPAYVMNEAGKFNPSNNIAPVAVTDTLRPESNGLKIIDVVANDSDEDGGTLRVARAMYNGPAQTLVRDNTVLYAVPSDKPPVDTVFYELIDTQGGIDTGMILVIYETSASNDLVGKADKFEISPNPAGSFARVSIEGLAAAINNIEISVLNMNGVPMDNVLNSTSMAVHGQSIQFDLSTGHLAGGLYTVLVQGGGIVYTENFVVVR